MTETALAEIRGDWRPVDDEERKRKKCFRMERLNGGREFLGSVMQFDEGGKCQALTASDSLGSRPTFDEAKAAVEAKVWGR